MRLLIVAALVASAFAARDSLRWNSDVARDETLRKAGSFKTGFEYRFNLDSQVSNGLPVPGSEQAAMRTQSLVALSFPESESIAHLRIEQIRVASLQREIEQPKTIQPFELFDEIEINEENLRKLRLPLRFRYENGLISEIEFDRADAEWSKNIKRVYLNMLQVNLSQKNVSESPRLYSGKEAVFTAPEMTLEGDCEVTYTVLPEESREEPEMRVTKSINFDKCTRRVGQKNTPFALEKNLEKSLDKHNLTKRFNGEEREIESTTVFNYRILGSASRFLIKEVELRSVYAYSPLSDVDTLFTTFVSGKLRLVEVNEEKNRIPAPKAEKKESLLHSMEWERKEQQFLATGDVTLLRDSPYPEMKNKPEVVARLVKSLLSHMESEEKGIELAATHEMGRIVRVLRLASKEEIKRMHKEICESSSEDSQMKDLFVDALALAGSFNTVEHLLEKIRAREVSPLRASALLKQLASLPVPSEKIIHSLTSLCKDAKRQPLERQSCWLTVGALMNGVCGKHRDVIESEEERKCPRDLKEKFVRELTEQLQNSETRYEKILALKTMANSGMDLIVFPLEKIIRDEREEKTIRVQAIESLRKLRSVLPRKMVSILMPLYKNIREHPEIRVAAFHQIMQTLPEKSIVDQIIFQLEVEPSTQVYSYVHSALTHLSSSELPQEKKMAEGIKVALKHFRPQSTRAIKSTYAHYTLYNEEINSGASVNWAALFSNDSVLPKEIYGTHETLLAGQMHKHLAQIKITQNNIDQLLAKLIRDNRKTLEEVVVRGKRAAGFKPDQLLRDLSDKMNIVIRQREEKNAHALVYVRSNDMDYALLPIDEQVMPEILKSVARSGRLDLDEIESVLAKGFRFNTVLSSIVYDHSRTLVHSMGMPLVYSAQLPTIVKVDGEIKAEVLPKNGKSVDGFRVRLEARPTLAATHVTKVEIMNPLVNMGVKLLHSVQVNLPLDITTEMSFKKNFELKHTLALPKESRRLVQLQTRPVSFVRVWPKETRVYVQAKEKTIYVEQLESLVHKIEESFLEKATGIKVNVDGHVHGHIWEEGSEGIPAALLIGENNVEISFEKTAETPREYVIRTELENFKEESRMERPSMEAFFDDEETDFETEEVAAKERTRRGEFKRYVKEYKNGKGYSHRLFSEIKSIGGRKEHRAEIELKTVCDEQMRHCRLAVKGMTTPLLEKETRDWTFESEIEMLYPEMPETLKQLLTQRHREFTMNVESRWGSDQKNQMTVKIQGEQNKEQKKWMKMAAELEKNELTAMEEMYRLVEASMLNQYTAVVKYDIRCPVSRGLVDRLFTLVKAKAPLFTTSFEQGHNEKNIVRAQLTFEPATLQHANISIHTPTEKVVIRDVRVSSALPRLNIRRQSVAPIRSFSSLGSALVEETKAECSVESRKVRSFDDVIYRTPLTTCYSVLAKDCSSEEPEFAVLMKKIERSEEEKKMKIITKESVIELEKGNRNIRVTIDGEEVEKVQELKRARVYKKNENLIVVRLDDVTVEFDGYTANIKMSESYKNKQCGICGHFDGEKKTEFRRADNEETEDIEEFHRSFLVKDDLECKMEEDKLNEKRHYGVESDESSSSEESIFETKWDKKSKKTYVDSYETVEPVKKTRVVEHSDKVCFSMNPVPECPKKSIENEQDRRDLKTFYTCFSRNSESARLMREARREVLNLDSFTESYSETLVVPRLCLAI